MLQRRQGVRLSSAVRQAARNLFVHFSAIESDGYKSLHEGEPVSFNVGQGHKGSQATQVRPLLTGRSSDAEARVGGPALSKRHGRDAAPPTNGGASCCRLPDARRHRAVPSVRRRRPEARSHAAATRPGRRPCPSRPASGLIATLGGPGAAPADNQSHRRGVRAAAQGLTAITTSVMRPRYTPYTVG